MDELEVKREGFLPRISLEDIRELKEQYDLFRRLQKEVLEEGIDYGFPARQRDPSQKPSLYKSGAEKLTRLFGLIPEFELLKAIEEENFVYYMFKCTLKTRSEVVIGEGYGSCNSREKEGWSKEPLKFANNILKIAKKRAHVDAVLTGLGASNVFTQDLEDMEDVPNQNRYPRSVPKQNEANEDTPFESLPRGKQIKILQETDKLFQEIAEMEVIRGEDVKPEAIKREFLDLFGVQSRKEMTYGQLHELWKMLKNRKETLQNELGVDEEAK